MNRTDRLYAIVEELRAVTPRPRSARWLAEHFEVSVRTIERDIAALQQTGVPIWAQPGRGGGYVIDKEYTLPPLNLAPQEAIAMAVALETVSGTPFATAARSTLRKLAAVMPERDAAAARALADRVRLIAPATDEPARQVPRVIEDAIAAGRVLRIAYADRHGAVSHRTVEPMAFLGKGEVWYLLAWCRLREAARVFRLDRIERAIATDEVAPARDIEPETLDIPNAQLTSPSFP